MNERMLCFGTREFSFKSFICKKCKWYNECKDIKPKKRKRLLYKNDFQNL